MLKLSSQFTQWLIAALLLSGAGKTCAASHADTLALTNEVLLYIGEQYGDEQAIMAKLSAAQSDNNPTRLLITELKQAMALRLKENDIPWESAQPLGAAIRGLIIDAEMGQETSPRIINDFILSQYLYMAFYSIFELAPERPESIVSKNMAELMPVLKVSMTGALTESQQVAMRCMESAISKADGGAKSTRITPLVFYKCSGRLFAQGS